MDDEARYTLRLPRTLLNQLRSIAEDKERSINSVMVRALRAYVEQEEKRSTTDA